MLCIHNFLYTTLSKVKNSKIFSKPSVIYAEKRLCHELRIQDHEAHVSSWLVSPENVFRWEAAIIGPAGCALENGVFVVSIHFPTKFPFKPPQINFKTKIFHPNINEIGEVSIDVLGSNWSPVWTISTLLLAICSVLSDPVEPFVASNPAAKLYRKNKKAYERIAREWTIRYAKA
ncbi:unnamed protein product [Cochlearia groenlandica]